jgi:hypothetical protein
MWRIKDVQPHDVLVCIIEEQLDEIEIDNRAWVLDQILQQCRKIALETDNLRDFQQRFVLRWAPLCQRC